VNLEKVREAAERVARSEGLEVVDVEWKIGKQRFLRVYIDRVPLAKPAEAIEGEEAPSPYPKVSHADCERVSQQLSVILDVEELIPGPGTSWNQFTGNGPRADEGGGFRALHGPAGEDFDQRADRRGEVF